MSDDNIKNIGVKFKDPKDSKKMLTLVKHYDCLEHQYEVDPESDIVKCLKCKRTFNPMSVLVNLCGKESMWMRNREHYLENMKRLKNRSRTKCQHCGKITGISHR